MSATAQRAPNAPLFVSSDDAVPAGPRRATPRMREFLAAQDFERPTLALDLDGVEAAYRALAAGLGEAEIHYAVKANPHEAILARLARLGCGFDAASRAEIGDALATGVGPDRISFGNTVKRPADIAVARDAGIDLYAVDAEEEIAKIARIHPGARVFVRVLVEEETGAEWPLSRKFGVPEGEVGRLLALARAAGLVPAGLSFHVGSQTPEAAMWTPVLDRVARLWAEGRAAGHPLRLLNIGGGFPATYNTPVQEARAYGRELAAMIRARFGGDVRVMAEPGRGLVADAGVIAAEVLLVARKRPTDLARWVYLDIGKFSGLAETIGEAIRYPLETSADGGETGPCILAGPSCDSEDVLYERRPVALPLALRGGDRVWIHGAGAYTSTYASVGFNGFPPLDVVCF